MKQIIIIGLMLLAFSVGSIAQDEKANIIQQAIDTKNYVFTAQTATPQRGRLRQLTSEYDLIVRPDTVVAFLPYFGRAYVAPIDPTEGGIKFTSSDFDYFVKKGKKNQWQINITPKDVSSSDVRELYLEVFDNGRASLRVNSNNRQSISFDGYVKEGKPLEKKAF